MNDDSLMAYLLYLKLSYFREYHQSLAKEASEKNWTQLDFLSRLVEGETLRRKDRATKRRIQAARFPIIKTLEQFNWTWPRKINRVQVQHLFRLSFLKDKGNVIFMGGVGLDKTHLAIALAYEGCTSSKRPIPPAASKGLPPRWTRRCCQKKRKSPPSGGMTGKRYRIT